jgi:hypothetical protein
MPIDVTLPDDLVAKLQKHAEPFVDTPLSVIERAVAALDAAGAPAPTVAKPGIAVYNPAAAPNLSYTTPQLARIDGELLPVGKTYWNPIMFAVIEAAVARGVDMLAIHELLSVNFQRGLRSDSGYKYIENADISVQGQDANAAWKQTYRLASILGIEVEVQFVWQNTDKAAMPGTAGSLHIKD